MGRMSDKQVTIITAAAMGLLAIGLAAATYFFFYQQREEASTGLAAKKTERDVLKAKEKQLNDWNKDLPRLREEDKDRVDVLPTIEERKPQFFQEQIYALARESNSIIRSSNLVQPKTGPKGPGAGGQAAGGSWDRTAYKYKIEGEFWNVCAFLSRLEGMKRFVKVVTLRMTPMTKLIAISKTEKRTQNLVSLDMEVNFFYLK